MVPLNKVIFVSLLVATARCYVITNEDPVFPTQEILNDNSFIRILPNNEVSIVECPPGTYLNKASLTCQFRNFDTRSTKLVAGGDCTIERQDSGALPDPESCRSFILCGAAGTFVMNCPANLLFNGAKNYCDWPKNAECCEFVEKNSSRLVQDA